jgi:hypothetical protein
MANRLAGAATHGALRALRSVFDRADSLAGRPFTETDLMVPHTRSRRFGWTHYGVMIPDLPAPHRYFSIMSLIGATGALAFDNDHALAAEPRKNASVVTGTAATHPRHFGNYEIGRDGRFSDDGGEIRFGREVEITGSYPNYKVEVAVEDFTLSIDIENTDKVSWFFHSPVYKHMSLLSHYRGQVAIGEDRQQIEGLCAFEYGACPSPYLLRSKPLPTRFKAPLNHFVYHIINLDPTHQVLLSQYSIAGRPLMTFALLRSTDAYTSVHHDTTYEVLEYRPAEAPTPDGRSMRLPQRTRFTVGDRDRPWLELETTMDTPFTYGLGTGFVGGFAYTGQWRNEAITGRGYVEYIDRRDG